MKKIVMASLLSILLMNPAFAKIQSHPVPYTSGVDALEGFVAENDAVKGSRPGILVVHDWMGISEFTRNKAIELAKQGYVAMAVDVYGKTHLPKNQDEAAKIAGKYKDNRALLRAHIRAAYDSLVAMKNVDPKKIVVMGYCFGGTTALELARSGAELAGTVSFHGGLSSPAPVDAKNIHGQVLILHGADDPFVKLDEVVAFKNEMDKAHIKWKFVAYPGAVHAFAVPTAGNDNSKGAAYNAAADKASWEEFQKFMKAVL